MTPRQQLDQLSEQIANQEFVTPKQEKALKVLDSVASRAQDNAVDGFAQIFIFREEIHYLLTANAAELELA